MSMEMTFIVTWILAILIGAALGVVTYFVFEYEDKKKKEDEANGRKTGKGIAD